MSLAIRSPDQITVQSDVNCTLTFGDSTKAINPIISEIAGLVIFKWDQDLPEMSYKNWIQKVCFPGDKYHPEIKQKQEEAIGKFFEIFQDKIASLKTATSHISEGEQIYTDAVALYAKYWDLYQQLALKYEDPVTKKVLFTIFPSFIRLINQLKKNCDCTVSARTFGTDGPAVSREYSKEGFSFHHDVEFLKDGMRIKGQQDILSGEKLFETLLKTNVLGQDQFKDWSERGYRAIDGKKMYCVKDGIFQGKTVLTIALDDNLETVTHSDEPADSNARNIAFPIDIYGRATSWQSRGIIGIRVDTIRAALEENYLIDQLNNELQKRGYDPLTYD